MTISLLYFYECGLINTCEFTFHANYFSYTFHANYFSYTFHANYFSYTILSNIFTGHKSTKIKIYNKQH